MRVGADRLVAGASMRLPPPPPAAETWCAADAEALAAAGRLTVAARAGALPDALEAARAFVAAVDRGAAPPAGCLAPLGEAGTWAVAASELGPLFDRALTYPLSDPALSLATLLGTFAAVSAARLDRSPLEYATSSLRWPGAFAVASELAVALSDVDTLLAAGHTSPLLAWRAVAEAARALADAPDAPATAQLCERAERSLFTLADGGPPPSMREHPLTHRIVDEHLAALVTIARAGGPWALAHDLRRFGEAMELLPTRHADAAFRAATEGIAEARAAGDLPAAIELARGWAAQDLSDPRAALHLGNLLSEAGQRDAGRRWHRRAFERAPDDPDIRGNYATGLTVDGDLARGTAMLREVVAYREARAEGCRVYPHESDWDTSWGQAALNAAWSDLDAGDPAAAVAEAARWLEDPELAHNATCLAADACEALGIDPLLRWAEWEADDLVSPYTLGDLIAHALDAEVPDVAEARRLLDRGDELLDPSWRAVVAEMADLLERTPPPPTPRSHLRLVE